MHLSLDLSIEFLHLNVRLDVKVNQVLAEPPLLVLHVEDAGVVYPAVILTDGPVSPSELVNGLESGLELPGVKASSGCRGGDEGNS